MSQKGLSKEYTTDKQLMFLRMMVTNAELYTRVMNIMNAENFEKSLRPAAEFIVEHSKKYNIMPESIQIKAETGIDVETIPELHEGQTDYFLDEFENFTKRQEIERALFKAVGLHDKGDYNLIEKVLKDAVQISLQKDMGTDYFADPKNRLLALKSNNGQNSTGWPSMDQKLYGGFNRGELQIFAGGSGSGKSLFMQNLSVNWVHAGLSGIYITLELSEGLCAMRIDGMMTDTSSREIFRDIDNIEMKLKMFQRKMGSKFRIKYMPAQSTVNDIRAYCKELQIQTGMKIDFICVDYLDLLMPVSAKVSPSDLFVKDKYVSEELRNLAKELNVLFVTASQLNRTAVDEIEFDHSHISGGISKINTADNVFGIFTSRSMRERGQYQLQLMKTRSSSGVGQKIELDFNIETLRITDSNEDNKQPVNTASDILNKIRPNMTTNEVVKEVVQPTESKVVADIGSSKLKSLLKSLQSQN
jgi:archaellum biogenesis ATPase FlaH